MIFVKDIREILIISGMIVGNDNCFKGKLDNVVFGKLFKEIKFQVTSRLKPFKLIKSGEFKYVLQFIKKELILNIIGILEKNQAFSLEKADLTIYLTDTKVFVDVL